MRVLPPEDALSNATLHSLIVKLESIAPVSDEERQAIIGLPMTVRDIREHHDIVRDQDRPSQCCVILKGFAFRYTAESDKFTRSTSLSHIQN
jgi:hypothetical protein